MKEILRTGGDQPAKLENHVDNDSWMLAWSPKGPENVSGFSCLTPDTAFEGTHNTSPLGGLVLVAMFYLLEHDSRDFAKEIIQRANDVAAQNVIENEKLANEKKRTLNS